MGVDFMQHRVRTGTFNTQCRLMKHLCKIQKYNLTTVGSNIHLRLFCTMAWILVTLILTWSLLQAMHLASETLSNSNSNLSTKAVVQIISPMTAGNTTSTFLPNILVLLINQMKQIHKQYSQSMLRLSGDVEMNPGPMTEDSESRILSAIRDSENRVTHALKSVQDEMRSIKSELHEVKKSCELTSSEVRVLKSDQTALHSELAAVKSELSTTQDINHNMQLDIDHLAEELHNKEEAYTKLEDEVDILERKSISNNMRIFNLPEPTTGYSKGLKHWVIDEVLKVACPDERWKEDDIKYVKLLGDVSDSRRPLSILSFRFDDDKYRVYSGRAALRDRGIRVGDDLTPRQRDKLKSISEKGKIGYFYRGELVTKDREDKSARPVKQARRKLDKFDNVNKQHENVLIEFSQESMSASQNMITENNA